MSIKPKISKTIKNEAELDILTTFKHETKTHEVMVLIEETSKIYTDQTGQFPQISSKGNKYIHIAYVYDTNAIIATPVKSRKGEALLEAHTNLVQHPKYIFLTMAIYR